MARQDRGKVCFYQQWTTELNRTNRTGSVSVRSHSYYSDKIDTILSSIGHTEKVKRSRQQFLLCLDLVLIDCFVTLQDPVAYGKK